jgi:hypothetical protein
MSRFVTLTAALSEELPEDYRHQHSRQISAVSSALRYLHIPFPGAACSEAGKFESAPALRHIFNGKRR